MNTPKMTEIAKKHAADIEAEYKKLMESVNEVVSGKELNDGRNNDMMSSIYQMGKSATSMYVQLLIQKYK